VLESIRKDAYINIIDAVTGELLFHGYRNDRTNYVATTLFEPYILTDLRTRYAKKGTDMQFIVSLEVVLKSAIKEDGTLETMERAWENDIT
jgi:hypothetical protein